MDFFGLIFFWAYGGVMGVIGAGYYHFAFGVEKTNRDLAEAKEKIAGLEKHIATTQQMLPLKGTE